MISFSKTPITLLEVGTAVDMTIICFGKKKSQLLSKLSVSCMALNLETKLHSSQDLQWTGRSEGLQVVTILNWIVKGQTDPRSRHSLQYNTTTRSEGSDVHEKALNLFLSDIHFQNL